jgi:hypothetical protein
MYAVKDGCMLKYSMEWCSLWSLAIIRCYSKKTRLTGSQAGPRAKIKKNLKTARLLQGVI